MDRDEVIAELCKPRTEVMKAHGCKHATDCMCGVYEHIMIPFSDDGHSLRFIQQATRAALATHSK